MNPTILSVSPLSSPWKTQDPFLFCAHHRDAYPSGNGRYGPKEEALSRRNIGNDFSSTDGWSMYHGTKVPGFPAHPHRGFETLTITTEGFVDHADSLGAAGRYGEGDVQWITTGKGLQHSEMFPLLEEDKDNPLEIFQIWLNLPAKNKGVEPEFHMLWSENIPHIKGITKEGAKTGIKVITGTFGAISYPCKATHSWAANPANEVVVCMIKMDPHAFVRLPTASVGTNRNLYFYHGDTIELDGITIHANQRITLDPTKKVLLQNGDKQARLMLLQGRPIGEPVAKYGPFVMNTQAEINTAIKDFRSTQFGGWPWQKPDQVHENHLGRFARYPDGTEERPE